LSRLIVLALLCISAAAQTLTVTPQQLTFNATIGGGNPAPQSVQVSSDTPGTPFQVQKDPFVSSAWLTVNPSTGATPGTVTFSVDASRFFQQGSQAVSVTVRIPETNVSQTIEVVAIVSGVSTEPVIEVTPRSLSFDAPSGVTNVPPKQIQVFNPGGGFLNYQIAVNYPEGTPTGWLSVTPSSGTAQGGSGAPQISHAVGVNPTGLSPGQYNGTLRVSGNAANPFVLVAVTLIVGSPPSLVVDPGSLSFSGAEGGQNPSPQNITISSQSGGTIAYEITSNQPWLSVSPAQGTTASGSQVHTVSVNISGLNQGSLLGTLTLKPQNLPEISVNVSLTVAMSSTILTIPSRLDFSGPTRVPFRERRLLSIVSNPLVAARWTARVVPESVSWLKISPASGAVPGNLIVEIDNQSLGAATLEAQIEITQQVGTALTAKAGEPVAQVSSTALVPVSLTLLNQEGRIDATPGLLEFSTIEGSSTVLEQILYADGRGGPAINWQADVSTDNGQEWLAVSPGAGVAPTRLQVSADPAGLGAGVHHGMIRLVSGSQRADVPVSLLVQAGESVLATDQTSLYFEVIEGTSTTLEKTMRVMNRGSGTLNWITQVREQSGSVQWLAVTPNNGLSEGGADNPPQLTFTVRPDALPAGVQSALVEIASAGAGQSRFVTVVVNVRPAGSTVTPTLDPAGLLFSATAAGITPAQQQLWIRSNQTAAVGFLAGASTFSGGNWLQVQPLNGNAVAGGTPLQVSISHAGLAAGLYRGMVGVTFGDGTVRSAPVLLTVRPEGAGCVPAATTISAASPVQNFVAAAGRASQLEAVVADDCGVGVRGAAVLAVPNNGDPALPLRDLGGGRYGATWSPGNAGAQVNVRYEMVSGTSIAETTLVGTVVSTAAPRLSQHGTVNGASFARGEALSPGGIMSTFGFNLASTSNSAQDVPLPDTLGGVRIFVGGRQAPLFFAGFGQVNAQLPYEIAATQRTDVIASVNGQFTVPQPVTVASARPGVFPMPSASGPPRAIAQNQDLSLNSPDNPAKRGEAVIIYLTGTGEVDPAVTTGEGAPGEEPLARVALPATAMIGDKEVEILFLGLTPDFVGLTQANLIVPANSMVGPNVPVTITIDGQPSNSMVIAISLAE
jgi:uncharacterized protein (TIGR03437 family)